MRIDLRKQKYKITEDGYRIFAILSALDITHKSLVKDIYGISKLSFTDIKKWCRMRTLINPDDIEPCIWEMVQTGLIEIVEDEFNEERTN